MPVRASAGFGLGKEYVFGGLAAAALAAAALGFVLLRTAPDMDRAYEAIGAGPVTAQDFRAASFQIVPEMLAVIYNAFAETREDMIYDGLAQVAAAGALEALYLERVGAMVGGGLDEGNQELHDMELVALSSRQEGTGFMMNVKWQVVGTVGHATHMHVRGNTYAADLTIAPVDGAWRMTRFDLLEVDRTDAGTMVAAE